VSSWSPPGESIRPGRLLIGVVTGPGWCRHRTYESKIYIEAFMETCMQSCPAVLLVGIAPYRTHELGGIGKSPLHHVDSQYCYGTPHHVESTAMENLIEGSQIFASYACPLRCTPYGRSWGGFS